MRHIFLLMILSLISAQAFCAPKVIARLGATLPLAPYLKNIYRDKKQVIPMLPNNKNASMELAIHTRALSPGFVPARAINAPLLTPPIYIIGNDERSKQWLTKYATQLNAMHAVGFIVNVDSTTHVKALEKRFDTTLLPVNGKAFVKRFELTHYPVLISQHRIEQ